MRNTVHFEIRQSKEKEKSEKSKEKKEKKEKKKEISPLEVEIIDLERNLDAFLQAECRLEEKFQIEKLFEFFTNFSKGPFNNIFSRISTAVGFFVNGLLQELINLRKENDELLEKMTNIEIEKGQIENQLMRASREKEKIENSRGLLVNFIKSGGSNKNDIESLIKENKKLKEAVAKQKNYIWNSMRKESKVMKLLYEIRRKGVDIEQIYYNTARTPSDTSEEIEDKSNIFEESELKRHPKFQLDDYLEDIPEEYESEKNFKKTKQVLTERTKINTMDTEENDDKKLNEQQNIAINIVEDDPLLIKNNKFMEIQKKLTKGNTIKLKVNGPNVIKGFHEEFVARLDEFSQSLRNHERNNEK